MTSQRLGLLIGSLFGLVFVEVNSGALPTGVGIVVRVVGGLASVLVLVGIRRLRPGPSKQDWPPAAGRQATAAGQPAGIGFGRGYWLVVAAEVVGIAGGVRLLAGPLDTPDATAAWVALVVGVHFVALATIWAEPSFGWLGGSIAVSGVAGLVLGFADASKAAVATAGGVLPGALLLGFALWAVLRPADPAGRAASGRRGSGKSDSGIGAAGTGSVVGISE